MSWDVAKKAVDYILSHEDDFRDEGIIWDFIGGEPFLEIDLIDKICDYIKSEMYVRNHHWFNDYIFSFTTNGLNYSSDKLQKYIAKNKDHLSITITIDGTERKHDLNRVYKGSGKGSYQDVLKNIPLWLEQFPTVGTKITISSADIPYIKESVMHVYGLGIHDVHINCVFEDVFESIEYHSEILMGNRYRRCRQYGEDDWYNWLLAIKECGYATSDTYVRECSKIIRQYDLPRYDRMGL